jgi:hypothetical protein
MYQSSKEWDNSQIASTPIIQDLFHSFFYICIWTCCIPWFELGSLGKSEKSLVMKENYMGLQKLGQSGLEGMPGSTLTVNMSACF